MLMFTVHFIIYFLFVFIIAVMSDKDMDSHVSLVQKSPFQADFGFVTSKVCLLWGFSDLSFLQYSTC